ncbi:YqgE/AlgH family protein, partial [Paraperlucidibaca sp.]|uniref:YqgE/AlgH family protein n=1 Tax=Paraperlucidibaca sp. TaxID=2708021 RepID=UPI00398A4165
MKSESVDLTNQFLVAMPELDDGMFGRAVIYIFRHDEDGAAGLIVNHTSEVLFDSLLSEIRLPALKPLSRPEQPVLVGGPVHPELGFVL